MTKVLELLFTTTGDKTKTYTVDAPHGNLTAATIEAAMQTMITAAIIEQEGQALQSIKGARYVERIVTPVIA